MNARAPVFTKRVRHNPATGTPQFDGELVTAPKRWQSAPDHPATHLAYITDDEAQLLSKLDLHDSGVDKERHYGPKGIPSYNGIDGGLGDGATDSGAGTGVGGSAVGSGGAYADVNANEDGSVALGVGPGISASPAGQMGGQIADLSPEDQASITAGGLIAGPTEVALSGLGAFGRGLGRAVDNAVNNPVATAINAAVGLTPLGPLNTLANLTTGHSVGRAATAAGRGIGEALGLNEAAPTAANVAAAPTANPGGPGPATGEGASGSDTYSSAIRTLNEIANPKPPEDPTKGILIRNRAYNNPPPMTLANYGQQGEFQFFTPGDLAIPRFAQGGVVGMADGGFVVPADVVSGLGDGSTKAGHRRLGLGKLLEGPGTGMSDDIPAHIDGVTPARVADGEVYLSPQEVELVGGGDHKKGLARMYALMKDVRKKRTGKTSQPKPLDGGMAGGGPVTTGNSQWNFLTPQAAGNNATSDLSADVSRIQQTLAGMGQIPKQTFADGGVTQLPGGGQNVIPGVNVGYAEAIAPNDPQQQQSISNLNPTQQAATFDMEQKAGRAGWNMGTIWDTVPKFEVPKMPTFTPTQVPQIGPQGGGFTGPAPAPAPAPQMRGLGLQALSGQINDANVRAAYREFLGREPESDDIVKFHTNAWAQVPGADVGDFLNSLAQQQETQARVQAGAAPATGLPQLTQAVTSDAVRQAYKTYLGREAESDDVVNYHVKSWQNTPGSTMDDFLSALGQTAEYQSRTSMQPTPSGLSAWVQRD